MKANVPVAVSFFLCVALGASTGLAGDPTTADAGAAAPPSTDWMATAARPKIGLDWDIWPWTYSFYGVDVNLLVFSWQVGGQYPVAKNLAIKGDSLLLGARYSWFYYNATAHQTGSQTSTDQLAYGNPTVGVKYAIPLDAYVPDLRVHAGFFWTPPVLQDPDQMVMATAVYGAVTRGYFDVERGLPGNTDFRLDLGAEYRFFKNLRYRGDLNGVVFVPTKGGSNGGGDTNLWVEQSNEIEYRHGIGLGGGVRLQEVFFLTPSTQSDRAQVALEPFVGYAPEGPGFYARLGFLFALDPPSGFGFDKGKLAELRVTGGYHFE